MAGSAQPTLAEEDVLAATAVELALTFASWVRRRKWTIEYVDDTTIRQQMTVDFRLPGEDRLASSPGRGETIYVPLWISKKLPLTNVDVRDEEGRALPVLNRMENGRLASRGLFLAIDGAAAARQVEVNPDALAEALRTIATAQPKTDLPAIAAALESPALNRALEEGDERSALVQDLGDGFLLMVPVEYEPGRDRLIKLAFDTPHYWHGEQPGWRDRGRSALASLGLADKEQKFERISIGLARGTHFQLNAPANVDLAEAWIDVRQYDPDRGEIELIDRRQVVYDRPRAELNVSLRAAYDPDQPPVPDDPNDPDDPANVSYRDFVSCRQDTANIEVRLCPSARDVFAGALVICLLTTPLLWLVDRRLVHLDGQTSAALLLALPAILAAFLARPGEHAFAARLLFGVRVTALVVGACALGVAAIIGAGGIRQSAGALPSKASIVRCAAKNRASRIVGDPAIGLRALRCTVPAARTPGKPNARADKTAQILVTALAALATFGTLLLMAGFARTLVGDLRRRNKAAEESDLSPADG
jgi:hypothetical protein